VDAISAIERGLNFPSDETIEAISEVLEKPIFEFYRLDVEKYLDPKKTGYINSIIAMLYHLEEKDLRIIEGQIRVIREIKD
jgi:transcriptional regulator with XRE-family HTH domain